MIFLCICSFSAYSRAIFLFQHPLFIPLKRNFKIGVTGQFLRDFSAALADLVETYTAVFDDTAESIADSVAITAARCSIFHLFR